MANIIGIVVLFGLVAVSAVSLFVVGSAAVGSVQSDATVEQAESSMVAFADDASSGSAASFEPPAKGDTHVTESSRIVVEAGSQEVLNTSLGAIVYEHNGEQRVFEGGAVFASSGDRTQIVRSPPIQYERAPGESEQTLMVDVVTVEGSVEDLEAGTALDRAEHDHGGPSSSVDEPVTVTVESAYADAWARYFREQTAASVTHHAAANTVTATFPVQNPTTVDNSFAVDGTLALGGNIGVDSYDSRTAQGSGSVGLGNYEDTDGGDIVATDDFSGAGSMHVDGDLYINDSYRYDGGTSVDGNVYANGDLVLATNTINDTMVSGGTIRTDRNGITFTEHSELRAAGDFRDDGSNTHGGSIHVGGEIDGTGSWTTIENTASFTAGDTVTMNPSANPSQVTEHAAAPSTSELDRIDDAVSSIPDPSQRVADAFAEYGSAPDPGIGGNSVDQTLSAGTYRVNGDVDFGGNSEFTIDTSGGDVVLLVDGDFTAGGSFDATVVGDGQAHVYMTGNLDLSGGGGWTNPDGAGNRLFVYTAADSATTSIQGDFYGVIMSESDLALGGGTNVYGGIVMEGSSLSGGQNVYFDEALREEDITIGDAAGSDPQRTHLHVTTTTVDDD